MHDSRTRLKEILERDAFVRSAQAEIISTRGTTSNWLFDLRAILMRSDVIDDIATVFWAEFADKQIQIGCIETAGIALATALVSRAKDFGKPLCSGFFIRKSRKKDGLLKIIEGTLTDEAIVLVDDLMNSGASFIRQVEVLKAEGKKVSAIWCVIRFRDPTFYQYFADEGIDVHAVFELNDFTDALSLRNLTKKDTPATVPPFDIVWKFPGTSPSYFHVVPKSEPVVDGDRLYIGSDQGVFRALDTSDGHVVWEFRTGFHPKKKGIFSSPAVYGDVVIFGAYDGNVYALEKASGKKRWVNFDADWVGSSPIVAPTLGLVFIGLEFGLWRKRGGIAAISVADGTMIWQHTMPMFTHASPLYIEHHNQVVIGSNDGMVYAFDAAKGTLEWTYTGGAISDEALDTGFSDYAIKTSCCYDEKNDQLIVGNMNGDVLFLDRKTGVKRGVFQAEFGVYSTPLITNGGVIVSSLDKNLYCISLDSFQPKWCWHGGARIFSSPTLINGSVFIGTNAGQLAELDPETGRLRSLFIVSERITNRLMYSAKNDHYYLTTFANEVYCLKKRLAQ